MADYGNHFTSNSGNYNYNTRGHSYDDSGWVIVGLANSGNVSQPIPHPNGAEFTGNNTTCYFYTTNHMAKPNREVKTGNDYVAYFKWATDNKNTKGSIDGDFNFYPFGSKTDSKFVEPTGLDDTKHGVSPYSNSNNNVISRTNLTVKGTTFTAGYRRHKIQYEPSIRYDLASYNYGTNDNYKSDGNTKATGGRVITQRYDAFQTFYNIEDPYSVLNISIANHDDAKSSSPTFCTLINNKSEYRINHSYTYNPYKNSATWNNTNYLSFTYNTLPTYPKELVFTYGSNYNSISYDGGTITVEAKARYNGSYDRFTTSTANDDGFSSYKRYVDVTYSLSTFNSSTTPTGSNTYTFRIWQPGSKLRISYTWSIDGNPYWAHLSTTSGNTTKVTFDDQGDDKPSVDGTLSLSLNNTTISNGGSTTGSVSGVSWTAPTNKSARSCVLRQNMTVTNCCAQNITPKTSSGQPYQSLTLTQNGMYWNNPSFDMKWKVTQGSKTTTTYNDDYGHGWPTVSIGGVSTSDGTEKTNGWNYSTSSKSVSVSMPTISRPWVNTYTGGTVSISKAINTSVSYKGGNVYINLDPDITFRQGFTSGVSERTWTISNTANNATNQEYWTLSKFNDVVIKLPAISASNHTFGDATLSWRDTGIQTLSFSKSSKTWNNDNTDDSFTTSLPSNLPYIGSWSASANNGTLTFTSTTRNSSSTSGTITFSGTTYQDGVLTPNPSTITISQDGTNISGTITISGTGSGINTCSTSAAYPIDGNTTSAKYTLKSSKQLYITGQTGLTPGVNYTNIPYNGATITMHVASGTVQTELATTKKQDYSISVSSDIVSSKPYNHSNGIVISGSVQPKPAKYTYQYKVDNGDWSDSTTKYIQSNNATWNRDCSLDLKASDKWTDVNEGIYKYTSGYYETAPSINHTIKVQVVDANDNKIKYEGNSITLPQSGEPGWYDEIAYTFVTSGINCTTSIPVGPADKNYNESIDYGAFTVSNISSPISNPTGDTGTSDDISTYIYNYSNKLSEGKFPDTAPTAVFKGSDKTFEYNEPVSVNLGVSSISTLTVNYKHTGKKTWNYMYSFSIHPKSPDGWVGDTQTTTKSTFSSIGPLGDTTYTAKMAVVEGSDNKNWQLLTKTGETTVNITKPGTYVIYVAWFNGNDKYNELNSNTITIISKQKQFRIKLTLNITNASSKIYWDTDAWTLEVTGYQLQSKEGDTDWINDSSSITGITYTWTGADSTNNSTATVNVSSVTPGSDKSNLGSGKTVSVEVSSTEGYSGTADFNLYRFGQDYGGYMNSIDVNNGDLDVYINATKYSGSSSIQQGNLPGKVSFTSNKTSTGDSSSVTMDSTPTNIGTKYVTIGTYSQDPASLTWTSITLNDINVGSEAGTQNVTPTNSPDYTAGSDGKYTITATTSWDVPSADSPYTNTSDVLFNVTSSTFDITIPGETLDVNDYYKWSFEPADTTVKDVTLTNDTSRTVTINYPKNPKPRGENTTEEHNDWTDSHIDLTAEIKEDSNKRAFYKVVGGVTGAQDSRTLGTLKLEYTKTGTSATASVTQLGKTAGDQTNSATFKVSETVNCNCIIDTSISASGTNESIAYITEFTNSEDWDNSGLFKPALTIKSDAFSDATDDKYESCKSIKTTDTASKCTIGVSLDLSITNIYVSMYPQATIERLKKNNVNSSSTCVVYGPSFNVSVPSNTTTAEYTWTLDDKDYSETSPTIEVTTTPDKLGTRTFKLTKCTVTTKKDATSTEYKKDYNFTTYIWTFEVTRGTVITTEYKVYVYCGTDASQENTTQTIEHTDFDNNASLFSLSVRVVCQKRETNTTDDQIDQGEWTTVTNPTVTYSWDHGDSNTSTNTVTVDAGSSASDGNDTDVKCTVTYKGKTAYCTFTLKHYGRSYYNG